MPEQTEATNTMLFFDLSLQQNLGDSISSIGSLSSFEDSDEDESITDQFPRRRASVQHTRAPSTPIQQRSATRRPVSAGNTTTLNRKRPCGAFGPKAPPRLETRGDATNSLRTLLVSRMNQEQRRSRRNMLLDSSVSKLKVNTDLEKSSGHIRYSRSHAVAEIRDLAAEGALPTGSGHSRHLRKMQLPRQVERMANEKCAASMDMEGSMRWANQSNASMDDGALRLPMRQVTRNSNSVHKNNGSFRTQDTAASTFNASMDLEGSSSRWAFQCSRSSMEGSLRLPQRSRSSTMEDSLKLPVRQETIESGVGKSAASSTEQADLNEVCRRAIALVNDSHSRFDDSMEVGDLMQPKELPRMPQRQGTIDHSNQKFQQKGATTKASPAANG